MFKLFQGYGPTLLMLLLFTIPSALVAGTPQPKAWTILVYLNGHNDLDKFGEEDINEMEVVGSTAQTNLVVQWASLENSERTRRLFIQQDTKPSQVTSPVVQSLPRVDMGDYRSLIDFAQWGIQNYPAEKYFLIIWNHGGGWHRQELSPLDISWDDFSKKLIRTEELSLVTGALKKTLGRKLDILGFDACLMGMAEILSEIHEDVDLVVASQEVEPGTGWPYDHFLKSLSPTSPTPPRVLTSNLVEEYIRSYSGGSQGEEDVTLSVIRASAYPALAQALTKARVELTGARGSSDIVKSYKDSLRFYSADYVDLGDFAQRLSAARLITPETRDEVLGALQRAVLANGTTNKYQRALGLSIWFPESAGQLSGNKKRYSSLKFNQQTNWVQVPHKAYSP